MNTWHTQLSVCAKLLKYSRYLKTQNIQHQRSGARIAFPPYDRVYIFDRLVFSLLVEQAGGLLIRRIHDCRELGTIDSESDYCICVP